MTTYYVKNLTILGEPTPSDYVQCDGTGGNCNVFTHPNTFVNATRLWGFEYGWGTSPNSPVINLIDPVDGKFKLNLASIFAPTNTLQNYSFTVWKDKRYLDGPDKFNPAPPTFGTQLANQFEVKKSVAAPFGVDLGFSDNGHINIVCFYLTKGIVDDDNFVIPIFYQGNQSPYDQIVEV